MANEATTLFSRDFRSRGMGLSRTLGLKTAVAGILSRTWVVALTAAAVLALLGLLVRLGLRFLKTRRIAATLPGA